MRNFLAHFISDQTGVTAIEYGLCIVGMTLVGAQLQAFYLAIGAAVAAAI